MWRARAASFLLASAARHLCVAGGVQDEVLGAALAALRSSGLSEPATEAHLEKLLALPDYHSFGERFSEMPMSVHATLCGEQPCRHKPSGCGANGEDGARFAR